MSTHEFQENGEWEVGGSTAAWNVTERQVEPDIDDSYSRPDRSKDQGPDLQNVLRFVLRLS